MQGEEIRFASPTKEVSYEKAAEGVIPANTKASTKWAVYILCPVIVMTELLYLRNCYHSTVLLSDDDIALSHTKVVLYSQYRNSGVFDAPTQNMYINYTAILGIPGIEAVLICYAVITCMYYITIEQQETYIDVANCMVYVSYPAGCFFLLKITITTATTTSPTNNANMRDATTATGMTIATSIPPPPPPLGVGVPPPPLLGVGVTATEREMEYKTHSRFPKGHFLLVSFSKP